MSEKIDEESEVGNTALPRYSEIVAELSAKFENGPETLAERLRIRSAAVFVCRLEMAQADAAAGGEFDPVALAELARLTVDAIREASPSTLGFTF